MNYLCPTAKPHQDSQNSILLANYRPVPLMPNLTSLAKGAKITTLMTKIQILQFETFVSAENIMIEREFFLCNAIFSPMVCCVFLYLQGNLINCIIHELFTIPSAGTNALSDTVTISRKSITINLKGLKVSKCFLVLDMCHVYCYIYRI